MSNFFYPIPAPYRQGGAYKESANAVLYPNAKGAPVHAPIGGPVELTFVWMQPETGSEPVQLIYVEIFAGMLRHRVGPLQALPGTFPTKVEADRQLGIVPSGKFTFEWRVRLGQAWVDPLTLMGNPLAEDYEKSFGAQEESGGVNPANPEPQAPWLKSPKTPAEKLVDTRVRAYVHKHAIEQMEAQKASILRKKNRDFLDKMNLDSIEKRLPNEIKLHQQAIDQVEDLIEEVPFEDYEAELEKAYDAQVNYNLYLQQNGRTLKGLNETRANALADFKAHLLDDAEAWHDDEDDFEDDDSQG